jgi:hypothetical protein
VISVQLSSGPAKGKNLTHRIDRLAISRAVLISFVVVLMIIVPFIVSSPQFAYAKNAPGPLPVRETSQSSGGSNDFPSSANTVSSNGEVYPYVVQQVAFASDPGHVFQITGAQIAERIVTTDNKNYLYLFVNPSRTFALNTTSVVDKVQVSGYDTDNIYWNIQSPPSSSGGTMNFGTIGQDLDTGATSNTLSEWQWTDLNYVFGGGISHVNYNGSYDGGGPTACNTYSGGQERHSVYVLIVNSQTDQVYTITGGMLIQQKFNGLFSTTFVTLISNTQGRLSTAGDVKDCPEIVNPSVTPSMRWYVRTPPTSGVSTLGNFGITGSLGVELTTAQTTNALVLFQFVDRTFQTGYVPNQGCTSCVTMLESTNPVTGEEAAWPGNGSTTTTTTTTSQTTSSSSSTVTYNAQLHISPLAQNEGGYYYNVQTLTFTDSNGNPVKGAAVTYYENCGCDGGYFHGLTNTNGQTTFTDTYPSAGTYTEWASVTYAGHTYLSQKVTVQVP